MQLWSLWQPVTCLRSAVSSLCHISQVAVSCRQLYLSSNTHAEAVSDGVHVGRPPLKQHQKWASGLYCISDFVSQHHCIWQPWRLQYLKDTLSGTCQKRLENWSTTFYSLRNPFWEYTILREILLLDFKCSRRPAPTFCLWTPSALSLSQCHAFHQLWSGIFVLQAFVLNGFSI